jgi:hypothetical protein
LLRANELFVAKAKEYQPTEPLASSLFVTTSMDALYQRFKFVGLKLAFILMPDKAAHLECKDNNIELDSQSMPYPKLSVFAQSLLDVYDGSNLEDLIDGAILSTDWGLKNLDLDTLGDEDWWNWRHDLLSKFHGKASTVTIPPIKRLRGNKLEYWKAISSTEGKQKRLGLKYPPDLYETRFHKRKRDDPLRRKPDMKFYRSPADN